MQNKESIPVRRDIAMSITTKVMINKTLVANKMEDGMSKEEIRETFYPSLNKTQWQKALKKMKLSGRIVPKIDFEIVEEADCCEQACIGSCREEKISGEVASKNSSEVI